MGILALLEKLPWLFEPTFWLAGFGAVFFFALEYVIWTRKEPKHREDRDFHYVLGCLVFVLLVLGLSSFLNFQFGFGPAARFYLGFSGPPAAAGIVQRLKPSHIDTQRSA